MARLSPLHRVAFLALLWGALVTPAFADPVEIEVSGVEGDARANVEQALALPTGLVTEGKVDRLWLDRFAVQAREKATDAVKPFGYYRAEASSSVEPRGGGEYLLKVHVELKSPVTVSEVSVLLDGAGAGQEALKRMVREFPLRKGGVLLQPQYENAKSRLRSRALDLGYLDADFSRHEIRISPDLTSARINLVFNTGAQYFFDDATIEGAPQYPDPFLRRYLSFHRGEVFSYAKLGETQLNFTNAERFQQVLVTPEKEKAKDFHVPVVVQLTPAPRVTIRPGFGFGTDTGIRFSVGYRDLDLFRAGHDLNAKLYLSESLQGVAVQYLIPSPRDIRTNTTFQLNLQREDVTAYMSRLIALEAARNRSLGRGTLGTAYLRLQQENFTVGSQNSGSRLVLPGLRYTQERFDSMTRPTNGFRYSLEARGTHPFLGSDTGLVQGIVQGLTIIPLPWRLGLRVRGMAAGSLLSEPLSEVPPSLRFFAGGDQSVRGYSYKSLGPRDDTGQVVGGRNLLVGSLEIERALFKNWGVSLFFDAGNAFNDPGYIRLKEGAGIGAHYYSPVGAINLAVARRVNDEQRAYYIHVSVGFEL
ncbi:autotransporter assembly complex protein TamA [Geomonas sp. RF6]|uniref:autotransporter assembly complex protein TamA n=1 Tax=Geomonas sp. RF6 TaxID=2897342 RepID=UPI001E528CE8|nr:autotransporter assembly complex family protein [Geomonas sp. RF6]UFS69433.1 autotransporter assembly complex protein TamA [Geomonas sp. RF6]